MQNTGITFPARLDSPGGHRWLIAAPYVAPPQSEAITASGDLWLRHTEERSPNLRTAGNGKFGHSSEGFNELRTTIGITREIDRVHTDPNLARTDPSGLRTSNGQKNCISAGQESRGDILPHFLDRPIGRHAKARLVPFEPDYLPRNAEALALDIGVLNFDSMSLTVINAETEDVTLLLSGQQQTEG